MFEEKNWGGIHPASMSSGGLENFRAQGADRVAKGSNAVFVESLRPEDMLLLPTAHSFRCRPKDSTTLRRNALGLSKSPTVPFTAALDL